ncbi:MAG: DUF3299 domain-containing protein [Planctomycetota bacterium]
MESLSNRRRAAPRPAELILLALLAATGVLGTGCGDEGPSPSPAPTIAEADIPVVDPGNEAHSGDLLADAIFRVIRDLVERRRDAEHRREFEDEIVAVLDGEDLGAVAMRRTAVGATVAEILLQAERFRPRDGSPGAVSGQQKLFVVSRAQVLADRLRGALDPEGRDPSLISGDHLQHAMQALAAPDLEGLDIPEGYRPTTWRTLGGFPYTKGMKLPPEVLELDGRKVALAGYLMSLGEFEDIHDFMLVESAWACCFGLPTDVNQVITVHIPPEQPGLDLVTVPILVTGTMKVEEQLDDGYVVGIYDVTLDDVVEIE